MKPLRTFVFGLTCFLFGVIVQTGLAQKKGSAAVTDLFQGKEPPAAAAALLDAALKAADDGSWERIAVGRAWYLGGDKAKGQQIFDAVTSKKAESSDWIRIARVFVEAKEWDKAQAAFDKALAIDADDDGAMFEYGALLNLHGDRAKAESLFAKALAKTPRDAYHLASAGGSYLGVTPQP